MMYLQKKLHLNTSRKSHILIGLILGLWVYLFLAFIGPFDAAPLQFGWRIQIMTGYGLLFSLAYFLIIPLQEWVYGQLKIWNPKWEIFIVLLVFIISLPFSYFYYKSDWIVGESDFGVYTLEMFLPTALLILPLMAIARRLIAKNTRATQSVKSTEKVILSGQNKLDILQIEREALIAAKSAGNYVEIYFMQEDQLIKKLFRSTLKEINQTIPDLVQVHRSHLINPSKFIAWKNKSTIYLPQLEIPVSGAFKNTLLKSVPIHH